MTSYNNMKFWSQRYNNYMPAQFTDIILLPSSNSIQYYSACINFVHTVTNKSNHIFWYEHVFNKREIAHGLNRHGSIAWQWIYGAEKLIGTSAGSTYVWKTLMFIIISPACSSALSWLFFPSGLLTLAGVAMFSGVQCKRTNYACA